MYSLIEEDAKELLEKISSKGITISRTKLSDKIDIRLLRVLNNSILETQINGKEALYFSGKFIGTEIVKNYNKKFGSVEKIILFIKKLFKKLIIGIIVGVEKKNGSIVIKVDESAFCKKRKSPTTGNEKKCYFLAGFVSGILTRGTNKQYVGKEIQCVNAGDSLCVFEFSKGRVKSV